MITRIISAPLTRGFFVDLGWTHNPMGGYLSDMELVRLTLPRRTHTQSHIDYVIEVMRKIYQSKDKLGGYKITKQTTSLRHFTADFTPV